MDNLTHSLVGLTASKAGLERLSPATSVVCILVANAPDVDLVSGIFGDRWTLLHYHRGITHSILGTLLLALLIPSLFWLGDLIVSGWRRQARTIRFRGLLLASLIVGATHPLMDWTNNYGVRPLLPWSGKWFYGDLVFIIDPFLWTVLGSTAFLLTSRSKLQLSIWSLLAAMLTLFYVYAGVIRGALDHSSVVLALWIAVLIVIAICRKWGFPRRGKRKVAFVGLGLVLSYWIGLAFLHRRALDNTSTEATILTASNGEKVTRLAAMPTLSNPTHWLCVVESNRSLYRFELFLLDRSPHAHNIARFAKPDEAEAKVIAQAERDRRAQILLGFARFPVFRVVDQDCLTETLVQLADLRYTEPGQSRGNFSIELPVECPHQP
jgi:inner membrane protein